MGQAGGGSREGRRGMNRQVDDTVGDSLLRCHGITPAPTGQAGAATRLWEQQPTSAQPAL